MLANGIQYVIFTERSAATSKYRSLNFAIHCIYIYSQYSNVIFCLRDWGYLVVKLMINF